ncbi:MAG: metal-dependent transcriptional regulator [Candidatus Hodarchaeales archaeon]|jgi:Mn-dependent DtxR family transcriptional regulator
MNQHENYELREIEEEIMEVLFDLQISKTADQRIRMGEVLDRIGGDLAKTQLTNIVRRKLEPGGYVDYLPYEGLILTKEGFNVARRIARNHRLAEAMLYQIFDVPFDKVHEHACALEHGITDELADYIYPKLHNNKTPFGMPIPMGNIEDLGCDDDCLLDIPKDTLVELTRIKLHSARELLKYEINGVGEKMIVKKIEEDGVLVEIKSKNQKIPNIISQNLCVKPLKQKDLE